MGRIPKEKNGLPTINFQVLSQFHGEYVGYVGGIFSTHSQYGNKFLPVKTIWEDINFD